MKNSYLKNCLLLLLVLFCSYFKSLAQNIQARAHLDQSTIRIGDQTQLHLSVHQPAKTVVNFPQLADTVASKVQIVSQGKTDTVADKNNTGQITVTHNYVITSFDAGTYTIPAFAFSGGIQSNPLTLQVQTVKVDTTKAIFDIKQPIAVSYTFWDWLHDNWLWVLVPLLVILAVIGVIWYLRKRPKKEVTAPEVKAYVAPHIIALEKLNNLRAKKLWQQEAVKEYHSELSDIIREYLEKRYAIKTYEKTSDEIFASLKYLDINQDDRNKLRQVLLLADLVKFAKEKPLPAENEQSMDNAISFVNSTQQVIQPSATEGGDSK